MFARAKHFLLAAALAVPLALGVGGWAKAQQPIPTWTTSYPVTTYPVTTTTSYYYTPTYRYSYYPYTTSYYYGPPGAYYYGSTFYPVVTPYQTWYWGRPYAWRSGYRWWY
jgi:hypothetical protein